MPCHVSFNASLPMRLFSLLWLLPHRASSALHWTDGLPPGHPPQGSGTQVPSNGIVSNLLKYALKCSVNIYKVSLLSSGAPGQVIGPYIHFRLYVS
ncbi:hypothetical protein B0J11DRAFT_524618 [Dendryphion nanum]|uniref:Secreted protein n=1 Tax=Dendryphion nanum TaxID=256645 RepID=A0A9P9E027_9PLEO|nr:hypothetical protein B0J11DRAFT_524618 [Dendryphion nanum]